MDYRTSALCTAGNWREGHIRLYLMFRMMYFLRLQKFRAISGYLYQMHAHAHTFTCAHTRVYIHMHAHACTCTHTHVRTWILATPNSQAWSWSSKVSQIMGQMSLSTRIEYSYYVWTWLCPITHLALKKITVSKKLLCLLIKKYCTYCNLRATEI